MAMPAKYRDRLQEMCNGQLVITVDRDHCLLLYPLPEWEVIERKLVKLPSCNPHACRLQRLLIGHATETEIVGAGRILLPPPLRDFVELDKRVVVIGQGNKFDLWNEASWDERREQWLAKDEDATPLPDEMESLSLCRSRLMYIAITRSRCKR